MKILVEPSAHHLLNMGDVAMLTATVERLEARFPDARIGVIANDATRLAAHCPGVIHIPAAGRRLWLDQPYFGAVLHRALPDRLSDRVRGVERALRRRRPAVAARLIRARLRLKREQAADLDAFLSWASDADAVVVVGAGLLNDEFAPAAITVLELLEAAAGRGAPTAMFGQGVGPLTDSELTKVAGRILPSVDLICLREERAGRPILRRLGVADGRMLNTGDDAVELAFRARRPGEPLGSALGLGLRVARYSGVGGEVVSVIGLVLRAAAERHGADLVSLPISSYPNERDQEMIDQALGRHDVPGAKPLDSPAAVIEEIKRCRVVVTGSYHGGVFALAQGVPVVGLAKSRYYIDKFVGLSDQFEGHCVVVMLDDPDLRSRLGEALEEAWSTADAVTAQLLEAASRQVEQSRAAYDRFSDIVETRLANGGRSARGI